MNWNEDKIEITQTYIEVININNIELFGIIRNNLTKAKHILPLIEFVISRLETVSSLAIDNKIWDAEIVLRSALETFIKFLFITGTEKEEQDQRIDEYWNLLAEINLIKQSDQAKKNIKYFPDKESHKLAFSPLILPEKTEKKLKAKWTKRERQKIEQKWSFTEMIFSISKNFKGNQFKIIEALLFSYRMCSHVSHGDETGILIITERDSRKPEEREKAYAGHFIRILSDCAMFCAFLSIETLTFLEINDKRKFFF